MRNFKEPLKYTLPTILSLAAGIGVVATAILASKAGVKAHQKLEAETENKGEKLTKLETIKTVAPVYIPTVLAGAITVACVVESNCLNRSQQAALASAYALGREKFQKYKNKVKDIYGEVAHQKIIDELAVESCRYVKITAPCFANNSCLDINDDEKRHIFHDVYSDRRCETTFSKVLQAEYHLNRNYTLGANVSLNDFYDFLGLKRTDYGDAVGWTMESGYLWIDFNHRKLLLDDGTPIYAIEVQYEPEQGFADW